METNANFRFVGWIVGLLLLATVLFAVWLIDPKPGRQAFQVRFDQAVDGLRPGSVVSLSGVPVGTVETVALAKEDPQIVLVTLNLDAAGAEAPGLEASISRNLITGEAELVLDSEPGRRGVFLDREGHKFIPSAQKGGVFGSDARTTFESVARGVDNLADALEGDKRSAISRKLDELQSETAGLAQGTERFSDDLARTRGHITGLGTSARTLGRGAQSVDRQLSQGALGASSRANLRQIEAKIRGAANGLAKAGRSIPAVEASLNDAGAELRDFSSSITPIKKQAMEIERDGFSGSRPTPEFRPPSTEPSQNANCLDPTGC